jgi:hypothetical protein
MGKNNSDATGSSRRNVLKMVGASTAAVTAVLTVSAQVSGNKPTIDRYHQGLELSKKNNWDVHRWRSWLANQGFDFGHKDVAIYTPTPNEYEPEKGDREWGQGRVDNGPTKNELKKDETWHYMTYTRPSDSDHDRFSFEWSLNDGWTNSAEPPADRPGMSFEADYYNFPSDPDYELGTFVLKSDRRDSFGKSYWTFEYDDQTHSNRTTGRFNSKFDMPLDVQGYDEETRQIYTTYYHTWNSVGLDSIGFSTAGITMDFTDNTNAWDTIAWCYESEMNNGQEYEDTNPE